MNRGSPVSADARFLLPSARCPGQVRVARDIPTYGIDLLAGAFRISRGVPPLVGLSPYLSAAATMAARKAVDPPFQVTYGPVQVWLPRGGGDYAFGGAWAGDSVDAASAIFSWFYDDGWGGKGSTPNFACASLTASGCWGHRDELLGKWAGTTCTQCIAGAGYSSPAANNREESYDFLIVRPVAFPTPLVFTWEGGVVPYLPAGWEKVAAVRARPRPGSPRSVSSSRCYARAHQTSSWRATPKTWRSSQINRTLFQPRKMSCTLFVASRSSQGVVNAGLGVTGISGPASAQNRQRRACAPGAGPGAG